MDRGTGAETVGDGRRPDTVRATTTNGLRAMLRRVRGWTCDVRGVALDEQGGNLHLPLRERTDRRSPGGRTPAAELVIRRVVEFSLADAARTRRFDLHNLAYDPETRHLAVRSEASAQFLLTVDGLDVQLRLPPRPRAST